RTSAPVDVAPNVTTAQTTPVMVNDPAPVTGNQVTPQSRQDPYIERAAYRPENRRITATPAVYTAPNANSNGYMPGEESYVKTISSLSKTVAEQKDGVMRPSERIAYESDMAIVNDTIDKMKK